MLELKYLKNIQRAKTDPTKNFKPQIAVAGPIPAAITYSESFKRCSLENLRCHAPLTDIGISVANLFFGSK